MHCPSPPPPDYLDLTASPIIIHALLLRVTPVLPDVKNIRTYSEYKDSPKGSYPVTVSCKQVQTDGTTHWR